MMWGHAIGIYLLAGTVLNGLGHLVRARWVASGKIEPLNLASARQWILWVVFGLAVLLWPVLIITISVGWRIRRKKGKMEKFLGYCEHANALEPICGPCGRDIESAKKIARTPSHLIGRRPLISKAAEERTKAVLAEIARRQQTQERGAPGSLRVGRVEKAGGAGGVPAFPDPPQPPQPHPLLPAVGASADGSVYRCSSCGLMLEGFPPASTSEGWPLCGGCAKKPKG